MLSLCPYNFNVVCFFCIRRTLWQINLYFIFCLKIKILSSIELINILLIFRWRIWFVVFFIVCIDIFDIFRLASNSRASNVFRILHFVNFIFIWLAKRSKNKFKLNWKSILIWYFLFLYSLLGVFASILRFYDERTCTDCIKTPITCITIQFYGFCKSANNRKTEWIATECDCSALQWNGWRRAGARAREKKKLHFNLIKINP